MRRSTMLFCAAVLSILCLFSSVEAHAKDKEKKIKVLVIRKTHDDQLNADAYTFENLDERDPDWHAPWVYYTTDCGWRPCPYILGQVYEARTHPGGRDIPVLDAVIVHGQEVQPIVQTWQCDPSEDQKPQIQAARAAHWEVSGDKMDCEAGADKNKPKPLVSLMAFIVSWPGIWPGSNMKAGYHVASNPVSNCPGWHDKHGNPYGNGLWNFSEATIIAGSLPPGLTIDPPSGKIEGTPTEPGTWAATVQLKDLSCTYDAQHGKTPIDLQGRNTYDVTFTVAGDAPRRVR